MKNLFSFLLLAILVIGSPLLSAESSTPPKHVGEGSHDCRKGTWLYRYSQHFFPIGSAEDPVFADEYRAFLSDLAWKKEVFRTPWDKAQGDDYFESSFMEENTMREEGSLEIPATSSANTILWRVSFPSIPTMTSLYYYQLLPGCEDTIVDGVKKQEVATQFEAWRAYAQWRSHPTLRVLVNYINFQIAAKFDRSYQSKVELLRNSYLNKINKKEGLLYRVPAVYRGGEEWCYDDQWQRYFDTCDELVQGILNGMKDENNPFNAAHYPSLSLFYISADPTTGALLPHQIMEFTSEHDSSLPPGMPLRAVIPIGEDPATAFGYGLLERAPGIKIATYKNSAANQIAVEPGID